MSTRDTYGKGKMRNVMFGIFLEPRLQARSQFIWYSSKDVKNQKGVAANIFS